MALFFFLCFLHPVGPILLKIVLPASTADEQHQFCPDSWVPTETVIVNRDKEERLFVNFVHLALEFRREEGGKKNIGVTLANCKGKER